MKNARSEVRVAFDARSEVEVELGALNENHSKMTKELKEAVRARNSVEQRSSLKIFESNCTTLK